MAKLRKHIVVLSPASDIQPVGTSGTKFQYKLGQPIQNVRSVKLLYCSVQGCLINIEELNNPHISGFNYNFLLYSHPLFPDMLSEEYEIYETQEKNVHSLTIEIAGLDPKSTSLLIDPATFELVLSIYTEEK